jgi:hypothetical protein
MDEISGRLTAARLAMNVLPEFSDLFRDRALAEQMFAFESGAKFDTFCDFGDVLGKSCLVDVTTRSLFDWLLR